MEGALLVAQDASWREKWAVLAADSFSVYALNRHTLEARFSLSELETVTDASDGAFLIAGKGFSSVRFKSLSREEEAKWLDAIRKQQRQIGNETPNFAQSTSQSLQANNGSHRIVESCRSEFAQNILPQQAQNPSAAPRAINPIVLQIVEQNVVFQRFPVETNAESPRSCLPFLHKAGEKLSLWKIIKKFVGKSLANIALPVDICLPLSMLQMSTEFMAHERLFAAANAEPDAARRHLLVFTAVFLALGDLAHRARKPLNPVLGETYELVTPNFRLLAEQVQHHPPRCAFHADSPDYVLTGTMQVSPHCRLSGVEMLFDFSTVLSLRESGDTFTFRFPTVSFHGLLLGQFYIWLHGSLECLAASGARASVEFLPHSPKPESDFAVAGTQCAADGRVLHELSGRWDGELWASADGGERFLLARRPPEAPLHDQQYFLSPLSIEMNNLPHSLLPHLPPTDSRLRPDQRALEYGAFDLAEREKERIEEKQRARRKRMESEGQPHCPLWFELEDMLATFNERYWKCRRTGKWPAEQPDLFS